MVAQGSKPGNGDRAQDSAKRKEMDPNTRAAARELERTLGTRVKIVGDQRRGRIEISYFSPDDLSRIYDLIVARGLPP